VPATTTPVLSKDSLLHIGSPAGEGTIEGVYTGDFGGSPISIVLRYVSGKNISGFNTHKGLKRNMHGTVLLEKNQLHLQMTEPGTNQYDGKFDMYLDTVKLELSGKWQPNNPSLSNKTFKLKKKSGLDDGYGSVIYEDTLNHSLIVKENGTCIYEYYVNQDQPTEQLLSIKGNYAIVQDSLHITWEPNTLFPTRKSSFKVIKTHSEETEMDLKKLEGKEGSFTEKFMP
jgi:hypothetical protein